MALIPKFSTSFRSLTRPTAVRSLPSLTSRSASARGSIGSAGLLASALALASCATTKGPTVPTAARIQGDPSALLYFCEHPEALVPVRYEVNPGFARRDLVAMTAHRDQQIVMEAKTDNAATQIRLRSYPLGADFSDTNVLPLAELSPSSRPACKNALDILKLKLLATYVSVLSEAVEDPTSGAYALVDLDIQYGHFVPLQDAAGHYTQGGFAALLQRREKAAADRSLPALISARVYFSEFSNFVSIAFAHGIPEASPEAAAGPSVIEIADSGEGQDGAGHRRLASELMTYAMQAAQRAE